MQRDSDLTKAFQHFRRDPIGAGAYPVPRDWRGMAPAALALKAARAKVEALPGLQAAHAAALAALEGPPDVTQEAAAHAAAQAAHSAAFAAERAAQEAWNAAGPEGLPFPGPGDVWEARKALRQSAFLLEEARRALDKAKSGEKRKAAEKAAREALQWASRFKYARPVWAKSGAWHGPQSGGLVYFDKESAADIFRNIRPAHEVGGRYNRLNIPTGYYCDPFQDSTCVAFVAQLRGRNGQAFFVPGYRFTESDDGGLTVDISRGAIESAAGADWEEAEREAAKAADGMAERAAEEEREYQTAWAAGSQWANKKEEEARLRGEALAILKERKAAARLNPAGFPALCAALRDKVESILESIAESRKERAELAAGDCDLLYFYPDEKAKGAFCEAAGLQAFPA